MIAKKLPGLQALSAREKLLLANELWNEVEASQDDPSAHAAILELLEQRFAKYQQDSTSVVSWEEFKRGFQPPSPAK